MITDARSKDRGTHAIAGLKRDAGKPYLGDPSVVWKILGDMMQAATSEPDKAADAVGKATTILIGGDAGYEPMGTWNGDGIGKWIREHMQGVPDGDAKAAVEYALAHLVLHQWDLIESVNRSLITEQDAGTRLRSLIQNWTSLMLGIPYLGGDIATGPTPLEAAKTTLADPKATQADAEAAVRAVERTDDDAALAEAKAAFAARFGPWKDREIAKMVLRGDKPLATFTLMPDGTVDAEWEDQDFRDLIGRNGIPGPGGTTVGPGDGSAFFDSLDAAASSMGLQVETQDQPPAG